MPTQKAIRRALIGPDIHPGRWPSHAPIPLPLPGFDLPAVTLDDIRLWMATYTPHIDPDSHRGRAYAHGYNVAGKVAQEINRGAWPP
jgi:hypothetical protein